MPNLNFDVLWRDHGVSRGMRDLGDQTERTGARFSKFKVLAAGAGVAVGAAMFKFGKDSVTAFKESEASSIRLQSAFTKFPGLADTNIGALRDLNSELAKKTRFDDDATASGQAVLAQFKLTGTQITQLTPLLQDYAAKTGKDLPTAAQDLGKAMLGQGRSLKAVGINFKDTGSQAGNLDQVMSGLRSQVGGFAEQEGKSAAGQTEILRNQFGELEEAAGAKLLPALNAVVGGLTKLVMFVGDNQGAIVPLVGTVAGLAAVIWTADKATKAWGVTQGVSRAIASASVRGLNALKLGYSGVELSAKGAARASRLAQLSIPGVGLLLFAATTAMTLFAAKSDKASEETNSFADAMQSVQGKVTRATAALNENVRATAVQQLQSKGAFDQARLLGLSYGTVTDAALGNKAAIGQVNAVLSTALALNPQVSKSNSDLRNAAQNLAGSLGGVATQSAQAAESENIRRSAMNTSVGVTNSLKSKTNELKGAQKDLNTELQKSIDKFTILKEGALSTERANMAWEESVDNVRQSVRENGKTLDVHTGKGRSNRRAVLEMISALNDKVRSDVKEAGAVRKGESAQDAYKRAQRTATAATKDGTEKIREHARRAGLDKDQVNGMIREFLKTPDAAAKMGKGVDGAAKKVRGLDSDINGLNGKKVAINIAVGASRSKLAQTVTFNADRHENRAAGGVLPGWTPGRDVHDFYSPTAGRLSLSGGEAIMRPEWTRAVGGPKAVAAMNRAAISGQHFASGGCQAGPVARVPDGGPFNAAARRCGGELGGSQRRRVGVFQGSAGYVQGHRSGGRQCASTSTTRAGLTT